MLLAACALLAIGFADRPAREADHENSVIAVDLALYFFLAPIALVLHELGHVIAGKIAGVRMWAVVIGMGPRLIRFSVGDIAIEIHAIPAYGFVRGSSYGQSAWRLRRIIWIAGGPLMNLLVSAAVIGGQWSHISDHSIYEHVSFWLALGVVNSVIFLGSMIGPSVKVSDFLIRPDGRQLYSLIFKRRQVSDEQRKTEYISHRGLWLFSENRELEVFELIRQPLAEDPNNFLLRFFYAAAQLGMGEFSTAKENLADLLARHGPVDAARVALLNALTWAALCIGKAESSDEVEAWSAEASFLAPWDPSVRSTRGWLLVERGDFETGVKMLQAALRDTESRPERALIFCTLAVAAARRGNDNRAQLHLKTASKLDAGNSHLRHIRRMLDGLHQPSANSQS